MMTIDTVRSICRALPKVTEDIKWGHDLCTPETFGELVERPGIIPAPYMARNMWVQEEELGDTLDRRELEALVKASYGLVVAKLPRRLHPGAPKRKKR